MAYTLSRFFHEILTHLIYSIFCEFTVKALIADLGLQHMGDIIVSSKRGVVIKIEHLERGKRAFLVLCERELRTPDC